MAKARKQAKNRQVLTPAERICLEIANAFPESLTIENGRVKVKPDAFTERTRDSLTADLAKMYAEAEAVKAPRKHRKKT